MFHFFKSLFNERVSSSSVGKAVRTGVAQQWQLLLIGILFLGSAQLAQAQHTVTLSMGVYAASSCDSRVIRAVVSGGSGSYEYFWNASPPSTAQLGNGSSITVRPDAFTTFGVAVYDQVTGTYAQAKIGVNPIVQGTFDYFVPNTFTPNGDGINDRFEVRAADKSIKPIRANRYTLTIDNRYGTRIHQSSGQDNTIGPGYLGGQIAWDGREAPSDGIYYYTIYLYNCSNTGGQLIKGTVEIFGKPGFTENPSPSQSMAMGIYPNPASEMLTISPAQLLNDGAATTTKATKLSSVGGYEVKLVDKFNRVQRAVTGRDTQLKLDVHSLPEGTYFLTVTKAGKTTRKQILVTH